MPPAQIPGRESTKPWSRGQSTRRSSKTIRPERRCPDARLGDWLRSGPDADRRGQPDPRRYQVAERIHQRRVVGQVRDVGCYARRQPEADQPQHLAGVAGEERHRLPSGPAAENEQERRAEPDSNAVTSPPRARGPAPGRIRECHRDLRRIRNPSRRQAWCATAEQGRCHHRPAHGSRRCLRPTCQTAAPARLRPRPGRRQPGVPVEGARGTWLAAAQLAGVVLCQGDIRNMITAWTSQTACPRDMQGSEPG